MRVYAIGSVRCAPEQEVAAGLSGFAGRRFSASCCCAIASARPKLANWFAGWLVKKAFLVDEKRRGSVKVGLRRARFGIGAGAGRQCDGFSAPNFRCYDIRSGSSERRKLALESCGQRRESLRGQRRAVFSSSFLFGRGNGSSNRARGPLSRTGGRVLQQAASDGSISLSVRVSISNRRRPRPRN